MKDEMYAAEQISLFCRMNMNTKKELPIRSSEMGLLIYLVMSDGDKTPIAIARFFKVSKAMITNMITSLHKKEYLEKHPLKEDKRSIRLLPTRKAVDLVHTTYDEYYKTMTSLKEGMGEDAFTQMIHLLEDANNILIKERDNG